MYCNIYFKGNEQYRGDFEPDFGTHKINFQTTCSFKKTALNKILLKQSDRVYKISRSSIFCLNNIQCIYKRF